MKVIVPVKRVVDFMVKPRVKPDGSGVELSNLKMSMNPFDEIALEEAIRLKEKGIVTEIVAVSLGTEKSTETLRGALGLGADRAILVQTDVELQPLAVAKVLKAIVQEESAQLVIMGKQAIDNDNNQTGQMLSALLDWSQATFASKVVIENNVAEVIRETDNGNETLSIPLPLVITADLRLNAPRYANVMNIMKAKNKPLAVRTPEDYNIDVTPRIKTLKVEEPKKRQAGIKVKTVEELVSKLKELGVL